MELEVVQYRVQLIKSDLKLESGIQFGRERVPLEDELRALESQLEETLSAKQAAEDRLQTLTATGRRTAGSGCSDDGRISQRRSDSVDINRTNVIDTPPHAGHGSTLERDVIANARRIQRV